MKLTRFRIENYRSISDVVCDLSQNITVFAGKNESGKTNILDALSLINDDVKFTEEDRPSYLEKDKVTTIIYEFELSNDEKKTLFQKTSLKETENTSSDFTIELWPEKNEYDVSGKLLDDIKELISKTTINVIKTIEERLEKIHAEMTQKGYSVEPTPKITMLDDESVSVFTESLQKNKSNIPKIAPTPPNPNPPQDPILGKIDELNSFIHSVKISTEISKVQAELWNMRPNVVLFSSFEDTLPDEVPFIEFTNPDTLKKNKPIVYDLIKLSNLDVKELQTTDKLKRKNRIDIAANISTKKFSEFWKQNPIEFVFNVDNESASIFIRDKGKNYSLRPKQRSEGFQWFLSFFLRLESAGNERNNLILVDEPGLYLHFRAQKDVLDVFNKLGESNQIIFTTHSPYLIDAENLNQVRLVVKDDTTSITNNFHEGGTDVDTLTPIITAIGLDLTKDLFFNKLGYNVVVEGVSDYYYLRALLAYLKKNENYEFPENITFIPCVGNSTVGIMSSFLMALGLKFKILLDRKGTTRTANKLERDGLEQLILFAGKTREESIEDLFDLEDKKKYELDASGAGKGIMARRFFEKIGSGENTMESITIDNFTKLLGDIKTETLDDEILSKVAKEVAKDKIKDLKEELKEIKKTNQ